MLGRFQFSIRELILLLTAVAAVLGLARTYWKDSQPLRGTELTHDAFISKEVQQFAKKSGVIGNISRSEGGSGSSKFHQRIRSGRYSFQVPSKYHDGIVYQLRQGIADKISAGGCRIIGRSSSGEQWELSYTNDSMDGVVELMAVSETGDKSCLHVMFFAIEFKKRSSGFRNPAGQ